MNSSPRSASVPPTPSRPISERQNDLDMIDLLSAAGWHYGVAKRWHLVRVTGTVVLALAAPVVTFWLASTAEWVAAVAALWVVAGRTILTRLEDAEMHRGVTVQEQFDTALFGLGWNEGLAGPPPEHEDVVHACDHASEAKRARKYDWYPDTGAAPRPLDIVLCQRSSAAWGRRAHDRYATVLTLTTWAWFVAGLAMGIVAGVSLSGYLIELFLPSLPAFLDATELIRSHRSASAQKARLERMTNKLWERGGADHGSVALSDCRSVQDLSYRLRRHNPQVAQWYYLLNRARDERAMRQAAQHKIAQL
jgi:hypothetical protein